MTSPKPIRGCAMDSVLLDPCGNVVIGPDSYLAVCDYLSIEFDPEYNEAETIEEETACGFLCIDEPGCSDLRRFNVTINLCGMPPAYLAALTGDRPTTNTAVGTQTSGVVFGSRDDCPPKFSWRIWQDLAGALCTDDGVELCLVHHFACITDLRLDGTFTVENGPTHATLTGTAEKNDKYGTGPHMSWDSAWFAEEIYGFQVEVCDKPVCPEACELAPFPVLTPPVTGGGGILQPIP